MTLALQVRLPSAYDEFHSLRGKQISLRACDCKALFQWHCNHRDDTQQICRQSIPVETSAKHQQTMSTLPKPHDPSTVHAAAFSRIRASIGDQAIFTGRYWRRSVIFTEFMLRTTHANPCCKASKKSKLFNGSSSRRHESSNSTSCARCSLTRRLQRSDLKY